MIVTFHTITILLLCTIQLNYRLTVLNQKTGDG